MVNEILFRGTENQEIEVLLSGIHEGTDLEFEFSTNIENIKEYAKNIKNGDIYESYLIVESLDGNLYQLYCEDYIIDDITELMYMIEDDYAEDDEAINFNGDWSNLETGFLNDNNLSEEDFVEVNEMIKNFIKMIKK